MFSRNFARSLVNSSDKFPDSVNMPTRSCGGIPRSMCFSAATRTFPRSAMVRWTSSKTKATKRVGARRRLTRDLRHGLPLGRFGDGAAFQGELCDLLRLAEIGKMKIALMQAADGVSSLVANHHRNPHQVHARLKGGRFVAGRDLAGLGLRGNRGNQKQVGPIAHDRLPA